MNDDKRTISDEELEEVKDLIAGIEQVMESLVTSDATSIMALAEVLAQVTIMHSAGQVTYEGKNPVESLSRNVKAVVDVVTDALQRGVYRFPKTLEDMQAKKASDDKMVLEGSTRH